MLPLGMSADLLPAGLRTRLLALHPSARDALTLTRGRCACDLAGSRLPDRPEDDRRLRARYRAQQTPRSVVIDALAAHRAAPAPPPPAALPADPGPAASWPDAFAAFVVEHARNAGPALYWLWFGAEEREGPAPPPREVLRIPAAAVRGAPAAWLREGHPTVVLP